MQRQKFHFPQVYDPDFQKYELELKKTPLKFFQKLS